MFLWKMGTKVIRLAIWYRKHRDKITGEEKAQFVIAEYSNVLPNVIKIEFKKLNIHFYFRTNKFKKHI